MAGKDITIPFGPDRTGTFEPIADADAPGRENSMQAMQDPFEDIPRVGADENSETFDSFGERGAERPDAAPIWDCPSSPTDYPPTPAKTYSL